MPEDTNEEYLDWLDSVLSEVMVPQMISTTSVDDRDEQTVVLRR